MPQIFISYSHKDAKHVEKWADRLRRIYTHDEVWYDQRLFAGDEWWPTILNQIAAADCIIFLVSEDSIKSNYCKDELAEARRLRKPIIPILINGFPPEKLTPSLSKLQYVTDRSADFARLVGSINKQSGTSRFAPPKPPLSPEPTPAPHIEQHIGVMKGGTVIGQQNVKRQFVIAGSFIGMLALLIIALVLILRPAQKKPSFAYEFLVDTSAQMLNDLNGVPRHQIVEQAVEQTSFGIETTMGESFSQVWQGLRTAGGGDCNQTDLLAQGYAISSETFSAHLKSRLPIGENASARGIRETFTDMGQTDPAASDMRIVFMVLGSLDFNCGNTTFNLPTALGIYKDMGVSATLCAFTLLDESELAAFENFRVEMEQQGILCVYNAQDANEISRLTLSEIRKEVQRITSEEVTLVPNSDPINPIGAIPTSVPATIISSPTPEPSDSPTVLTPTTPAPTQGTLPTTLQPTDTPPAATNTIPATEGSIVLTSTTNPVVTAESPIVIVTEGSANLRSGPGTNYSIVATARQGDTFPVLAKVENTSGTWYLIQRNQNQTSSTAWIFGDLVEVRPPEAVIRPAATIPASPIPAQPTTVTQPTIQNIGSTTQVCSPGQWDNVCGGYGCPTDSVAQCNSQGSGWTCVWNPGTCSSGGGAPPPANTCPTSGSC